MRTAVGVMLVLVAASPALALYDCEVAKLEAAAKSALCRHKMEGKALTTSTPPNTTKCTQMLAVAFQRAAGRFGAGCEATKDATRIDGSIAWGVDGVKDIVVPAPPASDSAAHCARAKLIVSGRFATCRFQERAQARSSGRAPDFGSCDSTFTRRMSRIQLVYGASCAVSGDAPAISARVTRASDLTTLNVVLVFLDDTRFDMLAQLPQGMVPSLQRIADEGVVFENSFSPTPICAQSRASMLTGLRIQGGVRGGHGVLRLNQAPVLIGGADNETIGTWFGSAGRDAGFFGKYENGYSLDTAYEDGPGTMYVPPGWNYWRAVHSPEYFGGLIGATWYTVYDDGSLEEHRGCCSLHPNQGAPVCYVHDPACLDDQTYQTDVLSEQFGAFVESRTTSGWLGVMTPYASHGGHAIFADPAARHLDTLLGIPLWRPGNWNMQAVGGAPQWQGPVLPQALQPGFSDSERRYALESLLAVDEAMADLFDRLTASGQLDDTVIILSSDNGVSWGEHALWGQRKECPYEACQRVPLIVRMPDAVHRVVTDPVITPDLAPTIADLGEVPVAVETDGRSIRPLLVAETPSPAWRTDYCMEYYPQSSQPYSYYGVRDVARGYSYVEHANGVWELYDLNTDPWQLDNVVADPAYDGIRAELATRLVEVCR